MVVYPEENHFVGVCLQLNLVIEAETAELAKEKLVDALEAHVAIVIRKKYSEDLLSRPAPKKYWDKYEELLKQEQRELQKKRPSFSHPLTFVQNFELNDLVKDLAYA